MQWRLETIFRQSLRLLVGMAVFFLSPEPGTWATEPLLRVGQVPIEATLLRATAAGKFEFQTAEGSRHIDLRAMTRWSTQPIRTARSELLLTDGSRIMLADSWTGQPSWRLESGLHAGATLSTTTQLFGKVDFKRRQVRAIFLYAPTDRQQHQTLFDQLQKSNTEEKSDLLFLTGGDQWQGQVVRLTTNGSGRRQIELLLGSTGDTLLLPENRVAAILFGNRKMATNASNNLVLGLRDGSLLMAEYLVADAGQLRVRTAGGIELIGSNRNDIAYLRSLVAVRVYLSDCTSMDYQHEPYLEIPYPFRRDRNVLGGLLQTQGRNYAKGLGMCSAARLTVRLDTKEIAGRFKRFRATVAIDDAAAQRGSAIFRVDLQRDGKWQQAFASPVVRGGDLPLPITVDLGDAEQLALVVDFADRGDECDYANWFDARLE